MLHRAGATTEVAATKKDCTVNTLKQTDKTKDLNYNLDQQLTDTNNKFEFVLKPLKRVRIKY